MARLPRRSAPRRSLPARVLRWLLIAAFLFLLLTVAWVGLYRFVPPPFTATMAGDLLGGRGVTKDWMGIDEIDRDMVRAAIAAEDGKFCSHGGFDVDAIAAAAIRNAKGGRIRGGSTISQQTAKNAFLWQGGGYFRKGVEAYFTLLIEQMWPKRRIMEVYLNIAETGIGTYGVNAGAMRYFDHDASALSRTEASRIAAVLPLPKKRGAVAPKGFTRRYGNSIVARMKSVDDSCVYEGTEPPAAKPDRETQKSRKSKPKEVSPDSLPPAPLPGEDYESEAPVIVEEPSTAPPEASEAAPAPDPVEVVDEPQPEP